MNQTPEDKSKLWWGLFNLVSLINLVDCRVFPCDDKEPLAHIDWKHTHTHTPSQNVYWSWTCQRAQSPWTKGPTTGRIERWENIRSYSKNDSVFPGQQCVICEHDMKLVGVVWHFFHVLINWTLLVKEQAQLGEVWSQSRLSSCRTERTYIRLSSFGLKRHLWNGSHASLSRVLQKMASYLSLLWLLTL